jgi:hypothetical protein
VKHNLGAQPRSVTVKALLTSLIERREPQEVIVVHHYIDKMDVLQLEVERRSTTLGVHFERVFIR